jgi:beta-lactamase class A
MKFSQLNFVNQIKQSKDEKRARWLTFIFLLLTVGLSLGFGLLSYVRENGVELPAPLVATKLDLSELPVNKKPKISTKLNQWAEHELSDLPGQWAVKVKIINSKDSWSFQSDQPMTAASLIKLPVVASFYQQVELGEYDLNDTYVLKQEDKHSGGQLVNEPIGQEITWSRILELALSHSDNTAFRILRSEMGDSLINRKMRDWGMEQTDLEKNLTSADDIALFFDQLYQGKLVNQTHQDKMIADMTNTIYETEIPAGLPEGIRVAHKVGYEERVIADAGLIFVPNNPFIMVIMSQETNVNQAKNTFPQLAKEIYWQVIEN